MASTRLNKTHKTEIHNAVVADAAKDRLEELKTRETQLAMALYLQQIKGYGKHIQACPSGFFQTSDTLRVVLYKTKAGLNKQANGVQYKRTKISTANEGFYNEISQGYWHSGDNLTIGEEVRMPHELIHSPVRLLNTTGLGAEIMELQAAQDKLLKDLEELSKTIKSALNACNTVKQLVDNYPELKKYLPESIGVQQLAVAHGKIDDLISCTKAADCAEPKGKAKKAKKGEVIAL